MPGLKLTAVPLVLWALGLSGPVLAEASPEAEVEDTEEFGSAPGDITEALDRTDQDKDALLGKTLLDRPGDWWRSAAERLNTRTGLDLGFAYTALYQRLSDAKDDKSKQGAVGDLDLFGEWTPSGSTADSQGFLGFEAEYRSRLTTSSRPSDLSENAGSLWETTNDFDTHDPGIVQLWWQQPIANERLTFRIGKVDQTDFFDTGRLKDADLFFSNFAFSENPALANPDPGWGGAVALDLDKGWYLVTAIGDAHAKRSRIVANDFFDKNDYFTGAEFGMTPVIAGLGQGYYQFTVWHSDAINIRNEPNQPSGKGFAVRFEQEIGERALPFITYSRASGNLTDVRQLVTAGIGLPGIFDRRDDIAGVAVAWGQPEDRSLRNQYVAEVFYRLQFTEYIQLTPDIQLIADPSKNRDEDWIGVYGLRMRVEF